MYVLVHALWHPLILTQHDFFLYKCCIANQPMPMNILTCGDVISLMMSLFTVMSYITILTGVEYRSSLNQQISYFNYFLIASDFFSCTLWKMSTKGVQMCVQDLGNATLWYGENDTNVMMYVLVHMVINANFFENVLFHTFISSKCYKCS